MQRRDLLAFGVAALPAAALAGDSMARILVVGDSQAQGLAAGLQRQSRSDPSWRVIDRSRIATGLCSPSRFDWPAAAPGIAETEHGAMAVVMFGANDRPPIRLHGEINEKLAAAFCTSYGEHVHAVTEGLKRFCAAVIWVGHPIVRDPVYAEDMALLNRLYAAQSMVAGAVWFPSWPLFIDADGNFAPYGKGVDGQTTRLRADDGVHLTGPGYDVLAKALLPVIEVYRPALARTPAQHLLDCIVLGDSIAVGLGESRPDCITTAVSGITSERYVQTFPAAMEARTAVISLGVNDHAPSATAENLRVLRKRITASTVYWLLAGTDPSIRTAVRSVANEFSDRLIDVAPLAGPDHIHPDRVGYASLAVQTGGRAGQMAAMARSGPPAAAFAEFPGFRIWNGPYNLNGVPTKGTGR